MGRDVGEDTPLNAALFWFDVEIAESGSGRKGQKDADKLSSVVTFTSGE